MRDPRSKFYDGNLYARVVEPLLDGVHGFVAERLPPGERVLDACCGTGGLARKLVASGRCAVGVDLSPRNIECARRLGGDVPAERLRFQVADVAALRLPQAGRYDVATVVLALHEMPADARLPVVEALLGVAERVMMVDFAVPMPWNVAGFRNRLMELAAGREHYSAFRDYTARGGLLPLVETSAAHVEAERRIDGGTLQVVVARSA